jgi:hypothetical protein
MRRSATITCLLLLSPVLLATGQEPPPDQGPLPDGVAAMVRGEPISTDEFRGALVRRMSNVEDGQKVLSGLVEKLIVELEQRRRGLEVSAKDVEAFLAEVERKVVKQSGGTMTLDDFLKQQKMTREQFARQARTHLIPLQKLVAEDLDREGEVSQTHLLLWIDSMKKKHGVVIGGKGLPEGAYAKVGEQTVGADEFGAELLDALPASKLAGALWDLVIARAVQQLLTQEKAEVTERDVAESIEELRAEFLADERFKQTTFTFEQYVQTVRRMTLAELEEDPLFLAQVGLAKVLRGRITGAEVGEFFEKHRGRYGEKRSFIHLLVKADARVEGTFTSKGRSLEQARTIVDLLLAKYRRGFPFEKLVREESEDRSKYSRPDRRIEISRETRLPDTLKKAVFEASLEEVIGPIRTTWGFHLVKVVEVIPDPGFEASRAGVIRDMVRERRTKALLEIKQDPAIRLRY